MTIQEFLNSGIRFFYLSTVYYVIQLMRCVLFSFGVTAFVYTLRNTILKNRIFLKGVLWSLFIPVLFAGKLKVHCEKFFSWWTGICMNHVWICWLYLCGIFVCAVLIFRKRRKIRKMVMGMEKRKMDDAIIYVTKMPVTPFTVGIFKPKIIMPEVILKKYDRKEFQTILLHEKTHIRLGHLLFYFLWDILRVLLWLNPFLSIGTKYFREDMEEICDLVTIRKSGGKSYEYGQLLLKSKRILQTESKDFNIYATFAGNEDYQSIRQRVIRIAEYKSYRKSMVVCLKAVSIIYAIGSIFCLYRFSYERFYEDASVTVYGMDDNIVLMTDSTGGMISHDGQYIYIDMDALQTFFCENDVKEQSLFIYCGGFYKFPGLGMGSGFGYVYEENYANGIQKIPYESTEDIWTLLFKII